MTDIYDQHKVAFARVEAFVIAKNGERVATIAFKFPADGAGRLYAYAHWFGLEMVRGHASGGGYDKRSAACSNAMGKLTDRLAGNSLKEVDRECNLEAGAGKFALALANGDRGVGWDRCLRDAGFQVWGAV